MLKHLHPNSTPPERLVILGASGFVGKSVATMAAQEKINTLLLSSRDVDLTAAKAVDQLVDLLTPQDSVIFCAAIDKGSSSGSEIFMQNIAMARHVSAALQRIAVKHLIYISSDSVYGFETSLISEKTPPCPASLYGAMHRAREIILATETKVPLAVLRLTGIYGAGDTHNAYGPNRFWREVKEHSKIILFGEGEEMRDHLYVADVAWLILQTTQHGSTGLLNLAAGGSLSFRQVAEMIAAQTGAVIQTAPRRQPITHRHFDITARLMPSRPFSRKY